jgi:hypothetical protein
MIRRIAVVRIPAALLTALLAAAPLTCAAAPFSVRLGGERIVLDTLAGFTDTTELASPRLQQLGEALTSASNRILLFALTDADLRRFRNGDPMDEKQRFLLAATPRALERERVTTEQFAGMVELSLHELGKPPEGDFLKFLEKQPPAKSSLLAELKRTSTVFSVLQGTRLLSPPPKFLEKEKPPQYVLSTTTMLLLRGKALQLTVFTSFDAPQDLDWLKAITERWTVELQRLNQR